MTDDKNGELNVVLIKKETSNMQNINKVEIQIKGKASEKELLEMAKETFHEISGKTNIEIKGRR